MQVNHKQALAPLQKVRDAQLVPGLDSNLYAVPVAIIGS